MSNIVLPVRVEDEFCCSALKTLYSSYIRSKASGCKTRKCDEVALIDKVYKQLQDVQSISPAPPPPLPPFPNVVLGAKRG